MEDRVSFHVTASSYGQEWLYIKKLFLTESTVATVPYKLRNGAAILYVRLLITDVLFMDWPVSTNGPL